MNSAVIRTPPRAGLQVESVGLLSATPETLFVVRPEELAGGGRVRVPHRRDGVGGGVRAAEVPLTAADLTRESTVSSHRAKLGFMQLSASPYEERLTAPRTWWLVCFLVGIAMALIFLPFGTLPLLGALVGGTAVSAVVASSYGSIRIRVVGDSLIAGEAKIPVSALGDAEIMDQEEARAWRTYKADPRAFMLLRAYIPTALRVQVTDPADPTPYLYLSTREPERLVAALEAARASA